MLRREEKRGSQMQILTRSATFESILQSSWERNDSRELRSAVPQPSGWQHS